MLVEALSDLDGLGCECGYGVILVAVSEAEAAA